eukprot:COSAG02_NODE_1515_length_12187_cov_37.042025_4_plen_592_part_00
MEPLDSLANASDDVHAAREKLDRGASAFITELAGQDATELRDTSPSLLGTTQSLAPIERIEQQGVPPELEPGYVGALPVFGLPGPTPEATIMQAAADTIFDDPSHPHRDNERKRAWWASHFLSEESVAVVQDSFWWFFVGQKEQDQRPLGGWERGQNPYPHQRYQLFDRAADNFALLFMRIQDSKKDDFFANYHDALAQSIFSAWWTAFPKSRHKFDKPAFRQNICSMVAEWTTGRRAFGLTIDSEAWSTNKLLRPENLDKETAEDEKNRRTHQRYVDIIMGGKASKAPGGAKPGTAVAGAGRSTGRGERHAMFATGASFESTRHGGGAEVMERDEEDEIAAEEVVEVDGVDVYANSPFIKHFLLTHNCNPTSAMKESRIDFAAYYAAMPNSSILAGESVRINEELIAHYQRLADKTNKHVRLKRKETKAIKVTLDKFRDQVLQTGVAHEYSSRIVSIVAQRELQRKKQLAQDLQRQAAQGSKSGVAKKKRSTKIQEANQQEEEDDENALDEASAPSRVAAAAAAAAAAASALAEENGGEASPSSPAQKPSEQKAGGNATSIADDFGFTINDPGEVQRRKEVRPYSHAWYP